MKNPSIISIYRHQDSNSHKMEYLVDVFGCCGGGFQHCRVASADPADVPRAISAVVGFIGRYGLCNKAGFHLFAPLEIADGIPTWLGGTSTKPATTISRQEISSLLGVAS
jgi:hypothetical protein